MSHHSDDESLSTVEPTYPDLVAPEGFVSDIPHHLLEGATPADRFVMEQLSIARQSNAWCVQALLKTHGEVVHTNGRLRKAEAEIVTLKDDKRKVVISWRAVVKLGGWIVGTISFLVMLWQAFHGA